MNWYAILAIYRYEMSRTRRTLLQSIVAPVISTALYFVVFGAAIGHRINEIGGVPYGAFIVPGLTMLSVLTHSVSNAAFGIYFPRFTRNIYEILSAPISHFEVTLASTAGSRSITVPLRSSSSASVMTPSNRSPTRDSRVSASTRVRMGWPGVANSPSPARRSFTAPLNGARMLVRCKASRA